MRIRIMPTNILGSIAFALTPESPTIPMAKPAAYKAIRKYEKYQRRETTTDA
jgi:hypothetical protein